jgi:3-deoxy-D-manno-octulosonic-acid transferase
VAGAGWATARWSDGPPTDRKWEVLILDQVGPLAAVFRWADIAVIGGSLVRRGGHNPIEAASHGRSMIVGPHHEHFREIVHGLDQVGGIRRLAEIGDIHETLFSALQDLLQDSRQRTEMGLKAFAYVRNHHGVARRYARALLARM